MTKPKFKHLDAVKKVTEDKHIHFSGHVLTTFVSLDGIWCCVVQNPNNKQMFIAREIDLTLQLNPVTIKPAPPLDDPNRPINPVKNEKID